MPLVQPSRYKAKGSIMHTTAYVIWDPSVLLSVTRSSSLGDFKIALSNLIFQANRRFDGIIYLKAQP